MGLEDAVSEGLKENEKNVIGNWRKEDSCYVVMEHLAILSLQLCGK